MSAMIETFSIIICCIGGLLTFLIFLASILSDKGILYWISYWKTISLFRFYYHENYKKKLPAYERMHKADFSPVDIGLMPSISEYEIEHPCTETFQQCDGIHFFGTDLRQNLIDLSINKIQENIAASWIFLKLSSGDEYRLPGGFDARKSYIDSEYSFYSSGLQIKCLSPLRKWRISFNGLLQKCNAGENDGDKPELVHVRFSFIWLSMTIAQELNVNFNPKDIAKAFADASRDVGYADLKCFHNVQNRYEQWGQLMGTLSLAGKDDKELFLWSCRTRILDFPLWNEEISFAKFYMYFKDGYPLKVETSTVKNFFSNFTNAYTLNGLGGIVDVSGCDFDLNSLQVNNSKVNFSFKISGESRNITIEFSGRNEIVYTGPNLECCITLKPFKMLTDNGDNGFGILHLGVRLNHISANSFKPPSLLLIDKRHACNDKLVVLLTDDNCKSSLVAGGKGCSLALLTDLAVKEPLFQVPKGFVITTTAFENHIQKNSSINYAIQRLVDVSGGKINGELKDECLKCMEEFQSVKLSDSLIDEIQITLLNLYESVQDVRFSVRSSACGEDSEDLSAAGQMLTVLGVRGINNITDAVVKCWSSKFGFEAVQYARQNGQLIRSPMAVVIQEMVPSEVSGVMFTVDPVTGDPSHPYITANYGLGESVVSSLAEPDTIVLRRNMDGSVSVKEKDIGAKKTQIYMKAGEGTEEKTLSCESLNTCLSDEWAVMIGSAGILVEKCFCAPRDIEWAMYKDKLYLLQARPVTTLHTETEFELIHDQDTPVRSENEFWTRANTGEVFPGATSPLAISLIVAGLDLSSHRNQIIREKQPMSNFCPYFSHILPLTHKQVTISVIDTLYRGNQKEISHFQRAFEVGIFGRVVGTDEMHKAGVKKYGYITKWKQLLGLLFLFLFSFKAPKMIKTCQKKLKTYKIPLETFTTVHRTWRGLLAQMNCFNTFMDVHGLATFLSSLTNLFVITLLAKEKEEWDSELYCDFASVLSACSGIESADVPESLQVLAQTIVKHHGTKFSSLSSNMAYKTLMNDKGDSGKLFEEFLKKHGHRCIKEFDLYSTSWGMDPEGLMPVLQNLVSSPTILNLQQKEEITVEDAVSKIKTPLSKFTKRILKYILPWGRQDVRQREQTKSMLIKLVDFVRQTTNHLGKLMVQDGMLPSSELVYFLTLEEIREIIDTRRPGLVPKAVRRSRLHAKLDNLQFPEIMKGIPKPVEEEEETSKYSESFTLIGIPVCQGKVRAIARVVTTLSEASTIQSGDVLITHSTDIGWSPYFPMLSGVVTVLGGLISHGAVVAREYGLPCVVGVQKAMSAFKSGDVVILDGTKGTISKITC